MPIIARMTTQMYQATRISRSEFVPIRNLQYHVRVWGEPQPGQPPLVMVHGWMDVAASYQFVVDAFAEGRYVIAPDWRGFGLTGAGGADNFWLPDYLADLDALLDHYAPEQPVNLVGHSMGGNIVMMYAGIRPARIHRLINLEGFGLPATKPSQAASRYAKWMDEIKALHRGEKALRGYETVDGVARRLMKTNPRLAADKAAWLANHWAQPNAQGLWEILGDPAHKIVNANLYQLPEVLDIHGRIAAPLLAVEAVESSMKQWYQDRYTLDEYHERLKVVPSVKVARMADAGHMLHHDQPEVLARMIEDFIS